MNRQEPWKFSSSTISEHNLTQTNCGELSVKSHFQSQTFGKRILKA